MKKILVLGCSSFSGASMVDFLLKKKYFVLGTYSKKKPKILLSFSKNIFSCFEGSGRCSRTSRQMTESNITLDVLSKSL